MEETAPSSETARAVAVVTPLPRQEMLVLSCILLSEAMGITMLFPFLARMVMSFGVAESDAQVAFYAGVIAASFNFSQFISAFFWGRASDARGRRAVILFGLAGNVITVILFGLSRSFWWAVAARVLSGLSNGNVGVAKSYLAEISDETNAPKAYARMGLVWGMGMVLGPAVGGSLANIDRTFPALAGRGSPFSYYPYLLPCLVAALVNVVGFIVGYKYLLSREELAARTRANKARLATLSQQAAVEASSESDDPVLLQMLAPSTPDSGSFSDNARCSSDGLVEQQEEHGALTELHNEGLLAEQRTAALVDEEDLARALSSWEMARTLLRNKNLILTTAVYSLLAFSTIVFDETFSVWAVFDPKSANGAGFRASQLQLAAILMVSGCMLVAVQSKIFPTVAPRTGVLVIIQVCLFASAPLILVFPAIVPLRASVPWLFWTLLFATAIVRVATISCAFTSIISMVNNAVEMHELGAANGMAQASAALARAFGPFIGGALLAWSMSRPHPWPVNHHFVFVVGATCSVFAGVLTLFIAPLLST
ncbi:major facilitator superfamily transporter [Thecamonas trahens ATCC 50062]|uniref:Major facilitator superfamily transporter n=1 Tax=Thecamonas trahens ATCC 50062 TaxID=461836 RepID=A0A0L0DCF8_THETB|nr:major facilitator superfamily transporter [Thecamonas trahens ATCC 50062]KNC50024.1 major facilitator superfamily transporter [Thecamonas trahens ATCC 50062]|eukprot:XP_013757191.1 major facilitator superfamily transporter [Thecamonas trahens ATCC 50062]